MKIARLELERFLSYEQAEIDLLDRGIILLLGENGAGKSVLSEGISWVLYGTTLRGVSGDAVIHDPARTGKARGCRGSVDLLAASGAEYTIERYRKHKKCRNSVHLFRVLPGTAVVEDLSLGTTKATNARIVEILGLGWKTFRSTALFGQGQIDRFSGAADTERKTILDEILGMGDYTRARVEIRSDLTAARQQIADKSQELIIADSYARTAVAEEDRERLRGLEWANVHVSKGKQLQRETESEMQALVRLNAEHESIEDLHRQRDALEEQMQTEKAALRASVQADEGELRGARAHLADMQTVLSMRIAERDLHQSDREEKTQATAEIEQDWEASDRVYKHEQGQEGFRLQASLREAESAVRGLETKRDAALRCAVTARQKAKTETEALLHLAQEQFCSEKRSQSYLTNELIAQEPRLAELVETPGAICALCGVDLEAAVGSGLAEQTALDDHRAARVQARVSLETRCTGLLERLATSMEIEATRAVAIESLEAALVRFADGREDPGSQQQAEADATEASLSEAKGLADQTRFLLLKAEQAAQIGVEHPAHEQQIHLLLQGEISEILQQLAHLRLEITELTHQAKATESLVSEFATQIEAARKQLDAFDAESETAKQLAQAKRRIMGAALRHKQYLDDKSAIERTLATFAGRMEAHQGETNPHTARRAELLEQAATKAVETAAIKEAIELLAGTTADLEFWEVGFGPAGIRSLLLDEVLPALNRKARRYADLISNGKLSVRFDTESILKGGPTRDRFEMQVELTPGAGTYNGQSGGWKQRADLVQLLAFRSVAQRRAGGLDLLVLDEPLVHVDALGVEQAVSLVNEISAGLGTVLLCTHESAFQSYFDRRVYVEKDAQGVSTLREETA